MRPNEKPIKLVKMANSLNTEMRIPIAEFSVLSLNIETGSSTPDLALPSVARPKITPFHEINISSGKKLPITIAI